LALRGLFGIQTVALWLAMLCGIGLGLVVSALSKSQERAVGAIPLLILPQILFSEFAIPRAQFSDVVKAIEFLMPVGWCYDVFVELASLETDWLDVLSSMLILMLMIGTLGLAAVAALIPKREVVA